MENLIEIQGVRDVVKIFKNTNINYGICFYLRNSYEKKFECYCPSEDYYFDLPYNGLKSARTLKNFVCPHEAECEKCGCKFYSSQVSQEGLNRKFFVGYYDKIGIEVVFRLYRLTVDFGAEYKEGQYFDDGGYPLTRPGEWTAEECERIIFKSNGEVETYSRIGWYYNPCYGTRPCIRNEWKRITYPYDIAYTYAGNEKSDLKGTCLEGLYDCVADFTEYMGRISGVDDYLFTAIWKYDGLRQLFKAGYYRVVDDCIEQYLSRGKVRVYGISIKSGTLKKALGVEPNIFDNLEKREIRLRQVPSVVNAYKKYGIYPTLENFLIVTDYNFGEIALSLESAEKVRKVVKYIRRQSRQDERADIGIYADYRRLGQKIKYDFSVKEVEFPPNLMLAHDRAVVEFNAISSIVKSKEYYKAIEKYRKFVYADKEKYIECVPYAETLTFWSKKFSNCSGGYIDRVINGSSIIFLVRLKEFPLVPYYMFELRGKDFSLVQLRGVENSKAEKGVSDFVNGFVEKYRARAYA